MCPGDFRSDLASILQHLPVRGLDESVQADLPNTLETVLQAAGIQPRTDLEIGSREAIREAVARGLGLGAVSEAEYIPDPRFRPLRITGDPASTTTYVYCMRERADSLLVGSFLEAI